MPSLLDLAKVEDQRSLMAFGLNAMILAVLFGAIAVSRECTFPPASVAKPSCGAVGDRCSSGRTPIGWPVVDAGAGNEMIAVPPGPVTLSDRRTQRSWQVEVAPFQLSACPVTQSSYARVTGRQPSSTRGDRLPVEGVSWWDAVEFCNALSLREGLTPAYHLRAEAETAEWDTSADGYRLPTEAEWEHACRAGTTGPRYGRLDEIAWYRGNSEGRIHSVGGKQPNAWGLYDMLGNVWDWCWDVYDADLYGSYRVLRGGGWADEHWSCRASVRRRSHPTFRIDDVGFRIARSMPLPVRLC